MVHKFVSNSIREVNYFKVIVLSVGFLFILAAFTLPNPEGLSRDGQIMIGVLLLAALFWATEPIPIEVTAILVMVLPPLFGVISSESVFQGFGNKAVFFLLGAFMLAASIEKYGLHKIVALKLMGLFGYKPKRFILGLLFVGGSLSFAMPEHAVATLLYPIVVKVLRTIELTPKESNFGIAAALSLTFGTSVGSWGTLLGGARNPLTIGFLEEQYGHQISFVDWTKITLPVVLVSIPVVWFILTRLFPPEITEKDMKKVKETINKEIEEKSGLNRNEVITLAIFTFTVIMWVLFSTTLGVAIIALIGAILLFVFGVVDWSDIEERVPWGIILLYGGAITLGVSLNKTGAAKWIAEIITKLGAGNQILVILLLLIAGFALTNSMSNTAAVALLLPIGLQIATNVGISPIIAGFAIALSGGGALMLVVSTPSAAIAYSTGYFSTKDLFKAGFVTFLALLAIILLFSLTYWPFITSSLA
ncbi:MAG: Na+/H+ antiporter NhaD [Candidatus Methanohalarchaeum thermophilum]|uniref:Na+/H+ antiporter NhaD n=1 Tax=Methanohalarchaeum thermophilum TaxID=1903181 RepID=A0A1Q6DWC7_METT1|nr:MAG: Na+/H+ antiporter NhaD [Candidatus Methanohalarchaeum thermophilum]